jgi:hypothetical protein
MGASVGIVLNESDKKRLTQSLRNLSLDLQGKEAIRILSSASLPIRKAAKSRAKSKIKPNSGFSYKRNGSTYEILPGTIEKSIGNIILRKARVPMIDVGYRARGKYNGWFAHFVDAGTSQRKIIKTGANRGSISPRNIMQHGESSIPATEQRITKAINRIIKKHNSKN